MKPTIPMTEYTFISLNVRGLQNAKKRCEMFHWLKSCHSGDKTFIMLQETHSQSSDESKWLKEWGSHIEFCHGSTKSCGVAILFPTNNQYKIINLSADKQGRKLIANIVLDEQDISLVNIYAPTLDKQEEQTTFFTELSNDIKESEVKFIIAGGDFNVCLDPIKDRYKGNNFKTKTMYFAQ